MHVKWGVFIAQEDKVPQRPNHGPSSGTEASSNGIVIHEKEEGGVIGSSVRQDHGQMAAM